MSRKGSRPLFRLADDNAHLELVLESANGNGVENAIGGIGNDWMKGNSRPNSLMGGAGNDIFFVQGGGTDTVDGGGRSDTVSGHDSEDVISNVAVITSVLFHQTAGGR